MTTTLLTVLGFYYAVVLTIGFWRFRVQTKSEYVNAPNSTGVFVLTLSLLGTIVGGGMFLGIAQIGYQGGMSAFALGVAYLVGSAIIGLLAPTLREICMRRHVTTLFGIFESLYPAKSSLSIGRLFTWTTFVVFILMLAVQFLSIATFLKFYMSIHFDVGIMVGTGIVAFVSMLFYSSFGGFTRDMWTDVVQMVFITAGVGAIFFGGWDDANLRSELSALPPEFFTLGSNGVLFFLGSLFFVAPTFFVRFDLWQRIMTAKTDGVAKTAFITAGIVSFFFFAFFGLLGMYGKALGVTDSQFVALEVIQQKVGGFKYALAVAAFFAAVMSTADTFLGVTGLALAKGTIYRKDNSFDSAGDDKQFVRRLRRTTLVVGVVSLGVAYLVRDIVDAFALAFGLLMVFLPALIGGLVRPQANEGRAKWSVILGLVAVGITVPFSPKIAYLPGFVVSLLVYLIAGKFTEKDAVKSKEDFAGKD